MQHGKQHGAGGLRPRSPETQTRQGTTLDHPGQGALTDNPDPTTATHYHAYYERYHVLVEATLRRTGIRDPETVRDLSQVTWLKAWRGYATFTGEKFSSWVCVIARNTAHDYLRTHRQHLSLEAVLEEQGEAGAEWVDIQALDPLDALLTDEEEQEIPLRLAPLLPQYQQAILEQMERPAKNLVAPKTRKQVYTLAHAREAARKLLAEQRKERVG